MSQYKKIDKSTQKNVEGGYKQVVYFAPVDDFSVIQAPATGAPANLGDDLKVTLAHTFSNGNGFIGLLSKKHSVTTTSETTGDDGSQSLVHKVKFIILGDGASTLGTMRAILNENGIWLVKDQDCINAVDYSQFGDSCLQPDCKITFDGKTTKEGLKEYTVELTVKDKKFFYSGAITEKPSTSSVGNPTVQVVTVGYTGAVGSSIFLAVDANPAGNATIRTLTYVWKKGGVQVTSFSDYYVKFNAQVADSGSYTCEATDAYGHTVASTAMTVTIS